MNLSDDSLREEFRKIDSQILQNEIADKEKKRLDLSDDYAALSEEEIARLVNEYLDIKVSVPSTRRYPIEEHKRLAHFAVGGTLLSGGLALLGLRRRSFMLGGSGLIGIVIAGGLGMLSRNIYQREFHDGWYDDSTGSILIPEGLSGPWYDVTWGHEYIHHVQHEIGFKSGPLAREGHARGLEPIFCKSPAHQKVHQELSLRDFRLAQKMGEQTRAVGHVVLSILSNGRQDFYKDLLDTNGEVE